MSFILSILSKNVLISNINLVIMILNLIPIYPLDGGRIQRGILIQKLNYDKAMKISMGISDLFLIIVFSLSIFLIVYLKNFYLLIITLYIYTLFKKEMKKEKILRLINYLQSD